MVIIMVFVSILSCNKSLKIWSEGAGHDDLATTAVYMDNLVQYD